MSFDYANQELKGLTIFAFYGQISHTSEALSGSGTTWYFANTPVSQQGLRLIGTNDSGTGFILNYEIEPISGQLTLPESWSGVTANYNQYSGTVQFLTETGTWDPKTQKPRQRQSMWGNWHTNIPNMKPSSVMFSVVRTTPGEQVLNFVADQVIRAKWFLLMDGESGKAYEGHLLSDRSFSVNKGYEPFIKVELLCEWFGSFDPDANSGSGVIDWTGFDNE
jgi:hypothetical protein